MPFLKPFMPQTHTVPGFRLGPDLPSLVTWLLNPFGLYVVSILLGQYTRYLADD